MQYYCGHFWSDLSETLGGDNSRGSPFFIVAFMPRELSYLTHRSLPSPVMITIQTAVLDKGSVKTAEGLQRAASVAGTALSYGELTSDEYCTGQESTSLASHGEGQAGVFSLVFRLSLVAARALGVCRVCLSPIAGMSGR